MAVVILSTVVFILSTMPEVFSEYSNLDTTTILTHNKYLSITILSMLSILSTVPEV